MPQLSLAQTPPAFDMAVRVLTPTIDSGRPYPHSVVVDSAGNSYISGTFTGAISFGGRILPTGSASMFVAKIDAAGNYRWIVPFGDATTGLRPTMDVTLAMDARGNVVVAGIFTSATLTLGSITLTNAGSINLFVGKLDASGNWLSAVNAGGTSNDIVVSKIALDNSANVYIAGYFEGAATFGSTTIASAGSADIFVARLDANATWRWATRGGGSGNDWSSGIGLDVNNHVYVSGQFDVPGGQLGAFALPAIPPVPYAVFPPRTAFITRLDAATGTYQRVTTIGGSYKASINSLAVSPIGDCYVAGSYLETAAFGRFALNSIGTGLANDDVFVAKIDSAATWQWASTAGSASGLANRSAVVDAQGSVYVTGYFIGTQQFGAITVASGNNLDVYLAKLDAAGNWLWVVHPSGQAADVSTCLALGPNGSLHVVGDYISPTLTFSPLTIPGPGPDTGVANFLARMQPSLLSISGDSLLCRNGTTQLTASPFIGTPPIGYRWSTGATTPSISVTQPGTYTLTATFAGGYTLSAAFRVRAPSVPALPTFTLGSDTTLCQGQVLLRAPTSVSGLAYRWSDGSTGPTMLVREAGTYSLQVSTSCNSQTASRRVSYTDCPVLIPNVITPNNDQHNDFFAIRNLPVGDWALTLYNRWGQPVYSTNAYHHSWGAGAAPGHYYYLLRQVETNAIYKGWLEVIP